MCRLAKRNNSKPRLWGGGGGGGETDPTTCGYVDNPFHIFFPSFTCVHDYFCCVIVIITTSNKSENQGNV